MFHRVWKEEQPSWMSRSDFGLPSTQGEYRLNREARTGTQSETFRLPAYHFELTPGEEASGLWQPACMLRFRYYLTLYNTIEDVLHFKATYKSPLAGHLKPAAKATAEELRHRFRAWKADSFAQNLGEEVSQCAHLDKWQSKAMETARFWRFCALTACDTNTDLLQAITVHLGISNGPAESMSAPEGEGRVSYLSESLDDHLSR